MIQCSIKLGICFLTIWITFGNLKAKPKSEMPPNVIIILTDDQGYRDVGFNGCKDIPTPNIDRIADNGVKFTNAYVTYAVCGPSRAGIMTGRYQDRFGFGRNPLLAPNDTLQGLPSSEETLATVLKRSGYTSMALGKWHLGVHKSQYPLNRGFDEFFGFLSGGHHYFPEEWTLNDISEVKSQFDGYRTKLMRNNGRINEKEYLTEALSREAVSFIDRNSDKPFFIYLAYNAPHAPMQATEKYLKRFKHIDDKKRRTYAAMVSAVDDGVGLVLDKLEEKGIKENTIVFFLSDNGGPEEKNGSDNGSLREGKSSLFEGGIHVPFAMQWPGKIPGGMVYEKPVISLDMFATAVKHANASAKNQLDGVDLLPFVSGKIQDEPHQALYWRKYDQKAYAIRKGDLKVIKYQSDRDQLYNLSDDISEEKPLDINADQNYSTIKEAYQRWVDEMKDPVFLGLLQDKKYSKQNPDRYKILNPYHPDSHTIKVPDGYELIWSDDFNVNGKPNEKYWNYEEGLVRNHELQWYQSDNANIKDGVLVIEGRREEVCNKNYDKTSSDWRQQRPKAQYTSACIKTNDKFSFQYGIMEVRARIDTSFGMWPAIWTLGVENRWPANGEVDQLEYYRHEGEAKILANAAWANAKMKPVWDSAKILFKYFLEREPDWAQRFHIWKMEWTEDYIHLYLDEELLNEIDLSKTINADGSNPFHQPQYILLNLAIGSNGGDPSNTTFPRKFEVDYVRVFQKRNDKLND